jgi:hypothetical protein
LDLISSVNLIILNSKQTLVNILNPGSKIINCETLDLSSEAQCLTNLMLKNKIERIKNQSKKLVQANKKVAIKRMRIKFNKKKQ